MDLQTYYSQLGINQNCSLKQIEKAYFKKAEYSHPSINSRPYSLENFITYHQAFEKIMYFKIHKKYNLTSQKFDLVASYSSDEELDQISYTNAIHLAQLSWLDFKNSDLERTLEGANEILYQFSLIFSMILFFAPLIGYLIGGLIPGLCVGGLIWFITVGVWSMLFNDKNLPNVKKIIFSFIKIGTLKPFWVFLLSFSNVILFFTIVLNTFLPITLNLFCLFYVFLGFGLIFIRYSFYTKFISITGIIPFIFEGLLLVNYVFSTPLPTETYSFKVKKSTSSRYKAYQEIIYLPNNIYSEQYGFRIFIDNIETNSKIKYHFSKGIFGLKVLKSREIFQ